MDKNNKELKDKNVQNKVVVKKDSSTNTNTSAKKEPAKTQVLKTQTKKDSTTTNAVKITTKPVTTKPANDSATKKTTTVKTDIKPIVKTAEKSDSKEEKSKIKKPDSVKTIKVETKPKEKTDKKEVKKENGFELLKKFKDLELKLVDVLKTIPSDVSQESKGSEKENIKSYIDKVTNARKIFDEYEQIAQKLTEMTAESENENESLEISKKVIESREIEGVKDINEQDLIKQYNLVSKQTKGLETVEIETMGDTVVVKKKKKTSVAAKEL